LPEVGVPQEERRQLPQASTGRERVGHRGNDLLSVVDADRVDLRSLQRRRVRRRRVAAHQDERVGRRAPDLPRRRDDPLVLERVHARDPDERGPGAAHPPGDRVAEAQIDDGGRVAPGGEGRGDVLEAERLDPEKRAQPEPFVARIGAQEQDVHRVQRGL
jgi:hypothetical protein